MVISILCLQSFHHWILLRSDPSKIAEYTKEDLDIFGFNMTATEVEQLNKLSVDR